MTRWLKGEVDTGDSSIHYYRTGGNKPAVILCHGLTDNGLCWQRLAQALEPDFDLIMPDARNHGLSGGGASALVDQADDLAAVVDALELVAPAAIGHSMGAAALAVLAARRPALFSRMVLEDPPWREPAQSTDDAAPDQRARTEFGRWIRRLADLDIEEIIREARALYPGWHDDDLPAWAQSKQQVNLAAMQRLDVDGWRDVITSITLPTLLVHGEPELGGIVTPSLAAWVHRHNDQFTGVQIKGAGHNVRREAFDDYLVRVHSFLDTIA